MWRANSTSPQSKKICIYSSPVSRTCVSCDPSDYASRLRTREFIQVSNFVIKVEASRKNGAQTVLKRLGESSSVYNAGHRKYRKQDFPKSEKPLFRQNHQVNLIERIKSHRTFVTVQLYSASCECQFASPAARPVQQQPPRSSFPT